MTSRLEVTVNLVRSWVSCLLSHLLTMSTVSKESGPDDRAVALLDLSISLIDQALEILTRHLKEDRQMTHQSKLMPGGSVGKHFRHVRSLTISNIYIGIWLTIEVMEMFRALLLPLQPKSSSIPSGILEVNYDAILPASRRPIARSVSSCTKAMQGIRDDLEAWLQRGTANERTGGVGEGVAGEVGAGGLTGEMQREVLLIAVTPTEQEMKSSVGREVGHFTRLRGRLLIR
jgi:hypothetical protein